MLVRRSQIPSNGSCGPIAQPTFGTQVAPTTTYDPAIVTGWGVRPYNWEFQTSIQQQVAPRVSVYAGYTRRWYGNLQATQNTNVTNASYTSYCITIPSAPAITGFAMPNGGSQQCGYIDLVRPTTANNVIQLASNFGANTARDTAYCDVRPPMQPNVKGQITYPFPWGIGASASFQSLAGAQINANYPLTNTTPGLTLNRPFSSVAPTVSIVAPGTQYLDRIYQTDIRFTKSIRYRATTIRPTVSISNLFNANPTNTNNAYQATYGAAWLAPTVILTPRFMDIGVHIDF